MLEALENSDEEKEIPDGIVIFPPDNANNENTDEDSGEEEIVGMNNLPGSQLRAEVEIINDSQTVDNEINSSDSEDDLPLLHFVKKPINIQKKRVKNRIWMKRDIKPELPIWNDESGPKHLMSPVESFLQIFDNEVFNMLTENSNFYAAAHNRPGDIQPDEMRCFVGILLLSGYVCLPRREMYWENADDTCNKAVFDAMSRNRFRFLMQNIHCNRNDELDARDKFSKIRPLFNILNKRFIDLAPKEECHSIDESMVPYFGRHGTKQFIRGKPIRWGYKFWCGTTRLGYIEWFEPYQGSTTLLPEEFSNLGLGASVVLQFANVIQNNNPDVPFHLYFDNFFTSLKLLDELKLRGIKGTGTIRENRVGKDCNITHSSVLKKKNRGSFEYLTDESSEVIICKWHDNNVVTMASNFSTVFPLAQVKRFSRKEKKNIQVEQPYCIKKYNENMGGVDRADQNISLYRTSIRGKKWYFPLFSHCVDMAEQNAWQLYRHNGGKLDHLGFRRCVALGILESFKKTTRRGPSRIPADVHEYSRYDGKDHLIVYKENQTVCVQCHKKANFACQKCSLTLHPKMCFIAFHSK